MFFGLASATDLPAYSIYKPIPAIYGSAAASKGGSLPSFGGAGTGGFEGLVFIKSHQGYRRFQIVDTTHLISETTYTPYADLMKEVKAGFGRTMSQLPAVFGVSRQTIYNWLAGEAPKEQHREKLVQLAAAAQVFIESGFKPTPLILERTVSTNKSFIELLRDGENGRETSQKLIRIVQRGKLAQNKLDALLGDRKVSPLEISDMGRLSFKEV